MRFYSESERYLGKGFTPWPMVALLLLLQLSLSGNPQAAGDEGRNLALLLQVLQQGKRPYVERGPEGKIVLVALPGYLLNDSNLVLVSRLETLRDLKLYGFHSTHKITGRGVAAFAGRTNLVSLRLKCFGECSNDLWQAVCNLRQLRLLDWTATSAAGGDYESLTNLTHLEELCVGLDDAFGDEALKHVANLPYLKRLWLTGTSVTERWTNIVVNCRALTNISVKALPRAQD